MTETDVTDLEEIEQGLKACGLQEKETDKEGSNKDINLEPDNDGEDTCPQKVPAEYKTGTDKESPTAPKPLPRKMNDGDIKSDVDVKNIKHDETPKGAVDMPTTKPGKLLPNDSRISRGDFNKMKEHLKTACSDFPKTTEYVEEVLEAFVDSIRLKKKTNMIHSLKV